jgi:hypothetical protein
MGGFGSGRRGGGGRGLIEACRAIDVNRLHQTGCLIPGWSGVCQWTADGQQGSIGLRVEAEYLILNYV